MMRKMFSCLLACALLLSLLAVNAGAVSNPNTSKETARTLIPENVATIIATYFLRDAQTIPDNAWSDNTSISNTVTMYDTTGDVSAYSFELETSGHDAGYIVVSAYPDTPCTILEFSQQNHFIHRSALQKVIRLYTPAVLTISKPLPLIPSYLLTVLS